MTPEDNIRFNVSALAAYPVRSSLILLAIAIGVTAVILLTSLGEGARRYVISELQTIGSNLLMVLPGKTETKGGMPPLTGETPHDLTINDAVAISRLPQVAYVAPLAIGNAPVSHQALSRDATLYGSTPDLLSVLNISLSHGRVWPGADPQLEQPVCLLGKKLTTELFGTRNAIGEKIRIGDARFRVIGILDDKGQSIIGMNFDDALLLPVASAQTLLNTTSLFRVMVSARLPDTLDETRDRIYQLIKTRHNDEEDITILTQDAMLSTFDDILRALTYAISVIGAISLVVAGVLTMNVMLISVSQRKAEIGLLKALGASTNQVSRLFLGEALLLSMSGGVIGMALSALVVYLLRVMFPVFPIGTPVWAWFAVAGVTLMTGLLFGAIPARRAARLHPVTALAG